MGPPANCNLNGTWRGNDGSSGTMTWKVKAKDFCCRMFALEITDGGNNSDRYGRFTITGSLSGEGTSFVQSYSSGQLADRVYDYKGEADLNARMEVSSISGTYTLRGENSPHGTFRFNAMNCR